MLKYPHTATYWSPAVLNEYGERSYGAPASISVRWEEKTEVFLDRSSGKEKISQSVVYLKQDVDEDGFMYLGASVEADPKGVTKSFLIRKFHKIPSLSGKKYTRQAWL